MNRNEPNALNRKIATAFFDLDGQYLAGQTFATASGEVLVSLDGAAEAAAAANAVAIGGGLYYYPASQAETNCASFLTVRLRKQATLSIATTHIVATIKSKNDVTGGNEFTLASVQSGAVTGVGTLVKTGNAYVFTFKNGVTTEANFETLITASADLAVKTTGTGANVLATTVDEFAATALTGGFRDEVAIQQIDQGTSMWAAVGEGAHTYGDLIRLLIAIEAGTVADFTTGTQVYKSLDGTKTRQTETTAGTGRLATVQGDLTP